MSVRGWAALSGVSLLTDWSLGLCLQTDPEVFFPTMGRVPNEAKRVCARCEIRLDCLEEALEIGDVFGVWGGTTQKERAKIRRDRSAT